MLSRKNKAPDTARSVEASNPLVKIAAGTAINRANLGFFDPIAANDQLIRERLESAGIDPNSGNTIIIGNPIPNLFRFSNTPDCPVTEELHIRMRELLARLKSDR